MKTKKTADERQVLKMNRYSESMDTGWQKFKLCFFCSRSFCVNNYPDRKPRTRKFQGHPICAWCDCRSSNGKINNIAKYKTLISRVVADRLDHRYCKHRGMDLEDPCTCLVCRLNPVLQLKEKDVS